MKDFWTWLWHFDTPIAFQMLAMLLIGSGTIAWFGIALANGSLIGLLAPFALAAWIIYAGYKGRDQ